MSGSNMPARRWSDWVVPTPKDENLVLIFGPQVYSAATTCLDIHPAIEIGPDPEEPPQLVVGHFPNGSRCTCARCHESGRDGRPKLTITAEDRKGLAAWAPETPDGYEPEPKATPTIFEGQPKPGGVQAKRQRVMKQFQRRKAKTQA